MSDALNALPAAITDQIENMQLDDSVKSIFVIVLSDQERDLAYAGLSIAAAVHSAKLHANVSDRLYILAQRFAPEPENPDQEAPDPSLGPLTVNRW